MMALGDVWSRSQWATRQPGWTGMQDRCPEVFIHHIGGGAPASPTVAWMRQFEDNALAAGRARGDSYIATEYHRLIFLDGTDVECRPDGTQGGATKNHNAASYAICLAGDFRTTAPTSQLIEAVRRRIEAWKGTGRVAANASVRPHSDVFPTACPGDKARAVIPQFTHPSPVSEDDFMSALTPDEQKRLLANTDYLTNIVKGRNVGPNLITDIQVGMKYVMNGVKAIATKVGTSWKGM